MKVRFKHNKPIFYISMVMFVLLSAFIVFEAALPSGISGANSNFFANISAWFINLVSGPQNSELIKPTTISLYSDSSFMGQDEEGISNITVGTTTLAVFKVEYPKDKRSIDKYDYEYSYERIGGEETDYTVTLATRAGNNLLYIDLRITPFIISDITYEIDIKTSNDLVEKYKFHLIDLAEPTNYESKIDKTNLKIGESAKITTKLIDEKKNEIDLHRYYDITKIPVSSSNNSVAKVDNFGIIRGISAGDATITYGKYTYDITVSEQHALIPSANKLEIHISDEANDSLSLYDYHYIFNDEDIVDDYSMILYPTFTDNDLEDKSVTWIVEDPLQAKFAPYGYDEDGYPKYTDEYGRNCIRLCGYRKEGNVHVTCISNSDPNLAVEIVVISNESIAKSMTLNIKSDFEMKVNDQKAVTATFAPKNTTKTEIHIEADNQNVTILNNDTKSPKIKANNPGECNIKISSISNPELFEEFKITISNETAINDNNVSNFRSMFRKVGGHMLIFLLDAVFGFLFFFYLFEDKKRFWIPLVITFGIGLFLAGLSELIQLSSSGRSASFADVGYDMAGFTLGLLIILGILWIIYKIKNRKKKNSDL